MVKWTVAMSGKCQGKNLVMEKYLAVCHSVHDNIGCTNVLMLCRWKPSNDTQQAG